MIWVTIILGIIQAIPALIELIKQILDAIHNKPLGTRLKLEHELQGHLLDWHHGGGDQVLKVRLHAMGHGLGCAAALPPQPPPAAA